jgi:hypothetical protein
MDRERGEGMKTLYRCDDDRHVLGDLSYAVGEAAPPDTLTEFGSWAYWRAADQDFKALLSFARSSEYVTGLRSGPDDARVLVFTASPLSLELEVISGRVVGQILPPGPGEVRVEASDGVTFQVEADDTGFFDLPGMPSGPVRLRCDTPNGLLVTDWVRL